MPGDGTRTNNTGLPQTTQQYALAFIMIVATAYRFCDIDRFNLWGVELTHALAVTHIGYWDLVRSMIYGDINPPGYRSVLYLFTQLFGTSEFILRAPSVLAGIASVYMVFVLGRRCVSATAGLLAATVLAGSSPAVFASQEVNFPATFVFYALTSFYCFLEIFFPISSVSENKKLPMRTSINTRAGDIFFEWKTALSVRPALLAWFWFNSISMIYLHYAGWLVLTSEFMVFAVWCRTGRSHCARALVQCAFVPIVLAYLTWLPACYIHVQKIWPQLVFNVPNTSGINQLTIYLLGIDPLIRGLVFAGLFLSILAPVGLRVLKVKTDNENMGSAGGMALFVLMLLAMLLLSACTAPFMDSAPEFMTVLPFVLLLSTAGAAFLIDTFVPSRLRPALLAFVIPLIVLIQLEGQTKRFVFSDSRKADIVSPLRLMMQDSVFMAGARKVFVSQEGLEYYLDTMGIRRKDKFQLNPLDPEDSKKVSNVIDDNVFYYLDVIFLPSMKESSPMLDALSQKYGQLCLTRFPQVRLVKFSAALPPSDVFSKNECPDNTTDLGKPMGAIK